MIFHGIAKILKRQFSCPLLHSHMATKPHSLSGFATLDQRLQCSVKGKHLICPTGGVQDTYKIVPSRVLNGITKFWMVTV